MSAMTNRAEDFQSQAILRKMIISKINIMTKHVEPSMVHLIVSLYCNALRQQLKEHPSKPKAN